MNGVVASSNEHLLCIRALLAGSALAISQPAFAQAAGVPQARVPEDSKETVLDLGIDLSAGYSDNLFATRNAEVDDFLLIVRPTARMTVLEGQDRLAIRGEGELGRYEGVKSENYDDWLVGVDGRVRAARNLTFLGGGEYQWEHESRSSPDDEDGLEPTKFERLYLFGGAIARAGRFTIRPAVQFNRYNFDDVAAAGGPINNDDRDRSQAELGARVALSVSEGTDLFVQGAWDRRDYDQVIDDFGYRRNSKGGSISAGLRKILSPRLTAELFAGYLGQDYADPRLEDVGTFDVGALVNWTGPRGLAATFRLDRSIEETTLPGASSYLLTSGSLTVSANPHPRIRSGLTLAGSKYDYRGDPRSEFLISAEAWLRYWLNRHIYAGFEYSLSRRTSNAAGFDYDENRAMLRLGAELRPHYEAGAGELGFGETVPAGFYAGIFGSHGTLITGLDGPRGQGSNTADFGDGGFAGGGMLGYGITVGGFYLGAEAEGTLGGPDWLHVADRVFSVRKKGSFGLAARLGWITRSNDLIYARAGASRARLRIRYEHSGNLFDEADRYTGLDFGVGSEAVAGQRGFVRAEYVLTSYGDIDVPTGDGRSDNFSTSEGWFRLGAGLRLGGSAAASAPTTAPTRFGGAYVGVQVGYGGLVSRNLGVRSGGTAVDIQRAGLGPVGGVFAGMGGRWRRFYAGAEVEAELSGIDWNIERDPNGRIYSTQMQYSLGVAARAGLMISDSAFLYGRIGPAWTWFRIPYATSGDSVLSRRTRSGLRLGGGMEVGIAARTRFRLDYSTTDYGAYDVEYGESNSDRFHHRDNIVRAGIAFGL